ncbi:hypothetical protein E4U35_002580 [Claviceps purpurea]|nr:hypothetical protein E4U37_005341 [Claviceps purpurea]KAG6172540.1 hypothetical protein E4U51_007265 [Claviceps purpurea]KAG6181430.1 hypothetical protein E4U36_004075 [Claviceps purpurea]KAG6200062.1 hypothetical protein E4U10_003360 [Claviceps purpurea]KAG6205482.1 hypothetical protein E4U35_002580 [Claviceps purpurea]
MSTNGLVSGELCYATVEIEVRTMREAHKRTAAPLSERFKLEETVVKVKDALTCPSKPSKASAVGPRLGPHGAGAAASGAERRPELRRIPRLDRGREWGTER